MIRLLITGGAGFIGSHTCVALLEKGYEIISLDSYINSSPKVYEGILQIFKNKGININNKLKIIKGDLRDKDKVNEIFREAMHNNNPIGGVIHFAGFKSVKESIQNPIIYWQNNVCGTINLVSVMKKYYCNKIVFSSSATIYKPRNVNLINEECEKEAINPYGNTKRVNEIFLSDVFKSQIETWGVINLRYFNPIGAHPSGCMGESPKGIPNNIFPIIMRIASKKKEYLEVFGNDWPTRDGTCIRDYIHITDLAQGHIQALKFLSKNISTDLSVNLGTGQGTSVLELIKIFEETNDIKLNYIFSGRREGDLPIVIADNTLARKILNWFPKKSISDMCKDGWNWNLKNPNGYL